MEQAGRVTWTAKPHRVAASESGDERVQSLIILDRSLRINPRCFASLNMTTLFKRLIVMPRAFIILGLILPEHRTLKWSLLFGRFLEHVASVENGAKPFAS
jgi:hypothetical protein